MADPAHEWTDTELLQVERRMAREYERARQQAEAEARRCAKGYEAELKEWEADVAAGRRTKAEFKAWREAQAAHGQWWRELANRLAEDYADADERARGVAADEAPGVYAEGVNYATFDVEATGQVDTSFSLYDADTVRELAKDERDLLPSQHVDRGRDVIWNRQHLTSAVTQSVLLGESVPKLAKRLQSVADMDRRAATRAARTALTAAENSGRWAGYRRAADMGIPVRVMWMATLDGRTRDSHRKLDGETIGVGETFSNGLRYPGDPDGPAEEVWNCRCTTCVASVYGVDLTGDMARPSELVDAGDPEAYARWKAGHDADERATHASGRSMRSFMQLKSVQGHMRKAGLTEQQLRDRLREQLRAEGHADLRSFPGLSRGQQQEALRRALAVPNKVSSGARSAWLSQFEPEVMTIRTRGGEVVSLVGDASGVNVGDDVMAMLDGAEVRHTHTTPVGGTFGADDINLTVDGRVAAHEVHATLTGWTYRLERRPGCTDETAGRLKEEFAAYDSSEYEELGYRYWQEHNEAAGMPMSDGDWLEVDKLLKPRLDAWLSANAERFGYSYSSRNEI